MDNFKVYSRTEKSRNVNHRVNQDRHLITEFRFMNDKILKLLIVADGISRCSEGEKAAACAVSSFACAMYQKVVESYLRESNPENYQMTHHLDILEAAVIDAIQTANSDVCAQAGPLQNTGTTISIVAVLDDCAIIANVGDSPVYFYRRETEEFSLVSKLHTVAEENAEEGLYERYSAQYYDHDHILCSSMGSRDTLDEERDIFIDRIEYLQPGDMFLVGSDGAFGRMMEEEIQEIVLEYEKKGKFALKKLFARARMDKHDDQTAILYIKGKNEDA